VLKDLLIRVDKLIFPVDLYILDMKDDEGMSSTTIISGKSFMMTTRTKIDVHAGSFTMEIGDKKVQFNLLQAMKHPTEDHSLFCIDLLSDVVNNFGFGILDVFSGLSSLDFFSQICDFSLQIRESYTFTYIPHIKSLNRVISKPKQSIAVNNIIIKQYC